MVGNKGIDKIIKVVSDALLNEDRVSINIEKELNGKVFIKTTPHKIFELEKNKIVN